MTAERKLAGAPITWGVSEVPDWGRQLDRDRVLSEIAQAGFHATELGPPGFLPADPAGARACLAAHGLELVGGFVAAVLHRPGARQAALAGVDAIARTLAGSGARVLVLAAASEREGYEAAAALDEGDWEALRRGVTLAAEIGRAHGLDVALHPHVGTLIEREDQIERILTTTDVGLCIDTGHLTLAGVDPVALACEANGRVAHVHLKDVDEPTAALLRSGEIGYREAVRDGLYRSLGDGDVDLEALMGVLDTAEYGGWYVFEQDAVIDGGDAESAPLDHAIRSLRYLREVLSR